jgi:hypothetical protein
MYPTSYREIDHEGDCQDKHRLDQPEPLIHLQVELEKIFPQCNHVKKISGSFVPHLTLSHFPSLDEALEGKQFLLDTWGEKAMEYKKNLTFRVEEIYILLRIGDEGQFCKTATIQLGSAKRDTWIQIHDPCVPFVGMPVVEEEETRNERMDLKERRNKNGRKRRAARI